MEKSIDIALNKFNPIPQLLRKTSTVNKPLDSIIVNLARLYHHYYLDNYGQAPPDPDPAQFEYLRFLCNTPDFRFLSSGLGVSTAARRHRSNEMGQAFCRYFLHDFLEITFFAHMSHIIDRGMQSSFGNIRVERYAPGDTPDYLCVKGVNEIYLAEAKGRYTSISFQNTSFNKWREQFNRVQVLESDNNPLSLKGFIVGTRFVTQENRASLRATIFAEDPISPGNQEYDNSVLQSLRSRIISLHYANIASKIANPVLASALRGGFEIPGELQFNMPVWELLVGPLAGQRFVGGYYSEGEVMISREGDRSIFGARNIFDLQAPGVTFFGLELNVYQSLLRFARTGISRLIIEPAFDLQSLFFDSSTSILRDGSIITPIAFVNYIGTATF